MNAVLALIARLFALIVLWTSVVYLAVNMQFEIESWSIIDKFGLFSMVLLMICAVIVIVKPGFLVKGIDVNNQPEGLDNLSLYHAGMVVAGMVMVYFALTDLVSTISYWYYASQHIGSSGLEVDLQMTVNMKTSLTVSAFKNILAFTVLLGAKGWAKLFYRLREAGLKSK